MISVDILLVADPKFSGGTTAALTADARAFLELGATIGLLDAESHFFDGADNEPAPEMVALAETPGVQVAPSGSQIRCDIAFFHHPMIFFQGVRARAEVQAKRAVIVTHHPPFRGDGSLEYDPLETTRTVARAFGVKPWWAPISGVTRRQLRSFAPLLRLTSEDWVNLFHIDGWRPTRPAFSDGSAVVGRHSRADTLKWPANFEEASTGLPSDDGWRVRVMGAPVDQLSMLGYRFDDWEVLGFNQEPVDAFLDSLDVFSYFYSPTWCEAFGRTIVEAMLMGRPCVLDPRLEDTFGDLAVYCAPSEARDVLEHLRANPGAARAGANHARETVAMRYAAESMARRLADLRVDRGDASPFKGRHASAATTLRKWIGLARRRRAARLA